MNDEKLTIQTLQELLDSNFFGVLQKMAFNLAISALEKELNSWISVSERPPSKEECIKNNAMFLITGREEKEDFVYVAWYNRIRGTWADNDDINIDVMAWQPLPELYKK